MVSGKSASCFLAVLCSLAVPRVALTQTVPVETWAAAGAGDRVVLLRDGSIARGQLVELVVNDHVTLRLATGEVKRYEWSQIKATREIAPAQPPVGRPLAAGEEEAEPSGPPRATPPDPAHAVTVEFRADLPDAQLYQLPSAADPTREPGAWAPVCATPCRARIDNRFEYAVWGGNMSPSSPFSIPPGATALRLDANVARRSTRIAGWIMMPGGILAAAAGAVWILAANDLHTESDDRYSSRSSDSDARTVVRTAGIVLVVAGATVAIAGLLMGTHNTTVDVKPLGASTDGRLQLGRGLALGPRGIEF